MSKKKKQKRYTRSKRKLNVLAIGAHFDDVELGCGGTVAKHVKNRDKVTIYVATTSAYSNYDGRIYRTAQQALKEGQKAAKILGAKLICDKYETKKLPYTFAQIERINKIIDDLKIDTIYTHWDHDIHQDHANLARVTLSAARHVPRILMYRSNLYHTGEEFKGNFYVDVSDFMKTKIKAIKVHRVEYKRRGKIWIDFFINENRNNGQKIGVDFAEVFEVVKYAT